MAPFAGMFGPGVQPQNAVGFAVFLFFGGVIGVALLIGFQLIRSLVRTIRGRRPTVEHRDP